ncbi:hypothetical protein BDF19DRAFT_436905 [Syncephalis fuscata]|nr:hypothetical protein BDF19DRAFT_436905 [Syncephalis fuscata]
MLYLILYFFTFNKNYFIKHQLKCSGIDMCFCHVASYCICTVIARGTFYATNNANIPLNKRIPSQVIVCIILLYHLFYFTPLYYS